MRYKNYVFDLYGTLIDIHTDESLPSLWRAMAELYSRYGTDISPEKLRTEFRRIELEERDKIRLEKNTEYPEIRIEGVFLRLRDELCDPAAAVHTHPCEFLPDDITWAHMISNTFRALSIKKKRLFPGAKETLIKLRENGAGVYLLSNAQRVFTMPEIEQLGLAPCFDAVCISSDHGFCKPDPRLFEILLDKEGLDRRETLMIGNEPQSDIAIAHAVGADSFLFDGTVSAARIREQYRRILL